MNRPERMNPLTAKQQAEMQVCFADASEDPMIGVVVVTGAGDRAFCVGGDVGGYLKDAEEAASQAKGGMVEGEERQRREGGAQDEGMLSCRKPVIARVNGYCIGHGNHLAYRCDFTIAAEHAIFGQNGPRVSSTGGGNYWVSYLTQVVGAKRARELWMLCRRYTAQEALAMGLVNAVVPMDRLDEEVDKWCEEIFQASPTCIEVIKATFDILIYQEAQQAGPGRLVSYSNVEFQKTPEAREGPAAFLEKRPANFWKIRKAELEARGKRR